MWLMFIIYTYVSNNHNVTDTFCNGWQYVLVICKCAHAATVIIRTTYLRAATLTVWDANRSYNVYNQLHLTSVLKKLKKFIK